MDEVRWHCEEIEKGIEAVIWIDSFATVVCECINCSCGCCVEKMIEPLLSPISATKAVKFLFWSRNPLQLHASINPMVNLSSVARQKPFSDWE